MKKTIVEVLAAAIDWLKAKNPTVFMIIQVVLVAVYAGISAAVGEGLLQEGSVISVIIEYGAVLMMALVGTRTVIYLPDDADPVNVQEWLAKILDSFKVSNPKMFAIIQAVLLTIFGTLTYGGLDLSPLLENVLKAVTMLAMILGGSRTGRYLNK